MAKKNNGNLDQEDISVFSLANVLAAKVEPGEAPTFEVDFENVENVAEVDDPEDTYEQMPEPEPIPHPGSAERLSFQDIGVILVNVLDGAQRTGFAIASKRMRFTTEEMDLLGNLDMSAKTIYPEGSPERITRDKYARHIEIIKQIPFSKEEKDRLITATVIYAKTVNLQLSPLQGLLAAYGEVLMTRGFTVFGDLMS